VSSRYILDRHAEERRRRMELLERVQDPATIEHLRRIGVAPGWRCLELGAGGGSIAAWLARRVGLGGPVSPHLAAFDELRDQVVASGRVGDEEFGDFLALADDPGFAWREGPLVSAWGRRPIEPVRGRG